MACETKAHLVREYETATAAFSEAVAELRRNLGTIPKAEYGRFSRR
jgi:hypothetical protein